MPVVHFGGPNEGEDVGAAGAPAEGGAQLDRFTTNLIIADQIGKFVAGELVNTFSKEDLALKLKGGENMIMGSISWG